MPRISFRKWQFYPKKEPVWLDKYHNGFMLNFWFWSFEVYW